MSPLRIIFFGTPAFVVPILRTLLGDQRFHIVGVVTQTGQSVGRKREGKASPVALEAARYNIPVFTPATLKDDSIVSSLSRLASDLFVVDAYGKILPLTLLNLPRHGAINLHPSLLPAYRGATPVPFALLHGETETGITFMRMTAGMDEGDILFTARERILPDDDAPTLLRRLNALGVKHLGDVLSKYVSGEITPTPQEHIQATYSTLLTKEHGRVQWHKETAAQIERKRRAFTPWPGIFTFFGEKRLKILKCETRSLSNGQEAISDQRSAIGKTYDPEIPGTLVLPDLVQTENGFLKLITVQPEGKKSMPFTEFLKGVREKEIRFR